MTLTPGAIPRELRDLDQWVVWRTEVRNGKPTKVPFSVTGKHAKSNDPRSWATFEEAVQAAGDGYDGIGFMFTPDDPYCGVDLDDVRDPETGELHEEARRIIAELDSYTEVSPSATGAKIIVRAQKPGTLARTGKTPWHGDIEMYDTLRYFALTGESIAADTVGDRQAEIDAIYERYLVAASGKKADEKKEPVEHEVRDDDDEVLDRAMNSAHFARLMAGDLSKYANDDSVADLAFVGHLVRLTSDPEQIVRLWRRSPLWRDKCERDDYRRMTLDRAFSDVRPVFSDLHLLNDVGNARRLVQGPHGIDLKFSSGLGWLTWDGARWKIDSERQAYRHAEAEARRLIEAIPTMHFEDDRQREKLRTFAKGSLNVGKIEGTLAATAWQREVSMPDDAFDAAPYRLNVLNGTLDLRTRELAEHARDDLITMIAPTEFDPAATSEVWDGFIERIIPDEELRLFVQRCAGYTIAGDPSAKYLMFAHGPQDTGKSTFLNALSDVLGDYAQTADFSTFIVKNGGRSATNDLARMRGVRFIKSLEVDEGERMAVGVVKALTGGDTIAARFLYKEHFEFKMEGVLWLAANARPKVDAADDAMWRRILHVPFLESIPVAEQDKTLGDKLRTPEAKRAILAWLVDGFEAYALRGIDPPQAVTDYTEEYRNEMNPLADFFESWAVVDRKAWEPWAAIKEHVQRWADDERIRTPNDVEVKAALRAAGCRDERKYVDGLRARGWAGIRLTEPVS